MSDINDVLKNEYSDGFNGKRKNRISELIIRRRRQVLVHSIIYYKMNQSLISDSTWSKWALELEELQKKYPDIAKDLPYAEAFENFDHSTGSNLPLDDPWANDRARQLVSNFDM